jgi:hypothetical protein
MTTMSTSATERNPEQIKARCEWLRERHQGDVPVWTSDQVYPIVAEYLRLLMELARLQTGVR